MNELLNYVRNIGYFLILMSLVSNIMPDNSYKKYCRMFCGLILVVLVLNPFYEFMNMDGDLSDAFANASYKSQVTDLKNQLISSDNSMNERIMDEFEQLIIDEIQGIATSEGLYILDVEVSILESEEVKLSGLRIIVTKDVDKYEAKRDVVNKKDDSDYISIDKINVGVDNYFGVVDENNENVDPMVISFINRVSEFMEIDTDIISVVVS